MLADYFFGTFGPVTPVRLHDDYGLDLFCAIAEDDGSQRLVREPYSVQVKSVEKNWSGWSFTEPHEIRWLIEHPNPVLLCVVHKDTASVEVFHTFGRFAVPPNGIPKTLVLKPGTGNDGVGCAWTASGEIDLSAPIIRASAHEFYDKTKHAAFRGVLENWLSYELLNLDYRRVGVLRYRMPSVYTTNEPATMSMQELGKYTSDVTDIHLGIRRLAEAADCIGDQLRFMRDMKGAVRAALLVDYLRAEYSAAGGDDKWWSARGLGHLAGGVAKHFVNPSDPRMPGVVTAEQRLDALSKAFDQLPQVGYQGCCRMKV